MTFFGGGGGQMHNNIEIITIIPSNYAKKTAESKFHV